MSRSRKENICGAVFGHVYKHTNTNLKAYKTIYEHECALIQLYLYTYKYKHVHIHIHTH